MIDFESVRESEDIRKLLIETMIDDPDTKAKLEAANRLYDSISEIMVEQNADDGAVFVAVMKLLKSMVDSQESREEKVRMLIGINLGVEALERGMNSGSII